MKFKMPSTPEVKSLKNILIWTTGLTSSQTEADSWGWAQVNVCPPHTPGSSLHSSAILCLLFWLINALIIMVVFGFCFKSVLSQNSWSFFILDRCTSPDKYVGKKMAVKCLTVGNNKKSWKTNSLPKQSILDGQSIKGSPDCQTASSVWLIKPDDNLL